MIKKMNSRLGRISPIFFLLCVGLLPIGAVFAQGQDSTPAERNLRVMAELLPGEYNNANQHYFDKRRNLEDADRHLRIHTSITPVNAPAFGKHVFLWVNRSQAEESENVSWRIATLSAEREASNGAISEVTMRHYFSESGEITEEMLATLKPADLRRTEGCDYYFTRRASHYSGSQREKACQFEWDGQRVYTDNTIELSESDLWFSDHKIVVDSGERITGVG
ncbi:MAG: CpcT/CpeT family chromophore lyase, partial [Gammaproteobacteria bacterium]|nr:CpcT/CpeT family chromophore lyase [Gammaproteobacteria bacterium]